MFPSSSYFFKDFDLERLCLDKYFFVVYDEVYAREVHPFDDKIAKENWQHRVYSRIKSRSRFVEVIRKEEDFSFYEQHLNGSRKMFCYVNLIKYIQFKKGITIPTKDIINKSNFLPVNDKTTLQEFIDAKQEVESHFMDLYAEIVREYWQEELENVRIKPVQLEIAYEVFPASVNDISNLFHANGISFRKYNTQSGTIYLNNDIGENKIVLPSGEGTIGINANIDVGGEIGKEDFVSEVEYVNDLCVGYSSNKVQIKFYQKSFGLVRIEFSVLTDTIRKLHHQEDYINYVIKIMRHNLHYFEFVKRFDISLEDIIKNVASAVGITEEICYSIKDIGVWESSRDTISIMRKLRRRGLLIPVIDDVGTKKRGLYRVAPWFQEIFKSFKPTGKELFLPGLIKKRASVPEKKKKIAGRKKKKSKEVK